MPPVTPPPELPSMPDVSEKLSSYLRRAALWAQGNFNNCLTKRTATGELYLTSASGNTVWRVTIDDAGALVTTQMTPGTGG
jgi:hypothetical protein